MPKFAILLMVACGGDPVVQDTSAATVPTWDNDIAPMMVAYCGGCHGDSACSTGFCWLDSYGAVVESPVGPACGSETRAECLVERLDNDSMPPNTPCPPGEPGCISLVEMDQLRRWVDGGFPEK